MFTYLWRTLGKTHPGLGLMVHAGEEYRTPTEGLRRVDMVLRLAKSLGRSEGSKRPAPRVRLGHALVLLECGEAGSAVDDVVLQPAIERLFDLWWETKLTLAGRVVTSLARRRRVAHDMRQLAAHMRLDRLFQRGSAPAPAAPSCPDKQLHQDLLRLLDRLHDPGEVLRTHGRSRPGDPLADMLSSHSLAERARCPVEVTIDANERAFIERAREATLAAAQRLHVTIECCPSSNLVVGDHCGLHAHPVHRPDHGLPDHSLPVCINTDDPLTFATCLADERAYALAGTMARRTTGQGMTLPEAEGWLESRRLDGEEARFEQQLSAGSSTGP